MTEVVERVVVQADWQTAENMQARQEAFWARQNIIALIQEYESDYSLITSKLIPSLSKLGVKFPEGFFQRGSDTIKQQILELLELIEQKKKATSGAYEVKGGSMELRNVETIADYSERLLARNIDSETVGRLRVLEGYEDKISDLSVEGNNISLKLNFAEINDAFLVVLIDLYPHIEDRLDKIWQHKDKIEKLGITEKEGKQFFYVRTKEDVTIDHQLLCALGKIFPVIKNVISDKLKDKENYLKSIIKQIEIKEYENSVAIIDQYGGTHIVW